MKPISFIIHPRSALVGATISCAAWLAISALPPQSTSSHPLRVQLDPDLSLIVRIAQGTPYTVPNHRLLAIKAVYPVDFAVRVQINGADVLNVGSGAGPQTATLSIPLVAQPGDVVTLATEYPPLPGNIVTALGYLSHD